MCRLFSSGTRNWKCRFKFYFEACSTLDVHVQHWLCIAPGLFPHLLHCFVLLL